jgi:hypothetical protein
MTSPDHPPKAPELTVTPAQLLSHAVEAILAAIDARRDSRAGWAHGGFAFGLERGEALRAW